MGPAVTSPNETSAVPDTVTSNVAMVDGGSKSEVRWRLVCADNEIVGESQGRSPYDQSVTVPACTSCTIFMKDTYGDGWQGGRWTGFGQTFTGPTDAQNKAWVSETFTTSSSSFSSVCASAVEANTTNSNTTVTLIPISATFVDNVGGEHPNTPIVKIGDLFIVGKNQGGWFKMVAMNAQGTAVESKYMASSKTLN